MQNKWVFLIQDAVQENLLALSLPFLLIWSSSAIYFFKSPWNSWGAWTFHWFCLPICICLFLTHVMLSNFGAGEDSWESLGQQRDQTSWAKGIQPWIFNRRTESKTEAPILWPPDAKSWLTEKTLMLGKIEGKKKRGWQRMQWLDCIINAMDVNLSKLWEIVKDREAWHAAVHGVTNTQTPFSYWTITLLTYKFMLWFVGKNFTDRILCSS